MKAKEKVRHLIEMSKERNPEQTPKYENGTCTFMESLAEPNQVEISIIGVHLAKRFFEGHKRYNYTTNSCMETFDGQVDFVCECFTQMVWKSTNRIGCAIDTLDHVDYYAACAYEPVGNVLGKYKDNVPLVEEDVRYED